MLTLDLTAFMFFATFDDHLSRAQFCSNSKEALRGRAQIIYARSVLRRAWGMSQFRFCEDRAS